jgi:hypothetical protein
VLTGGNGRPGAAAQTNTFAFDVPAGRKDVDVSVTLRGSVNQGVIGYLVSPDGQILSQATNVLDVDANGTPTSFGQSLQGYRRDPAPGRWTYVVVFQNPVSGATTREPFTGQVRYDLVSVSASGLPRGVVPAGQPVHATVRVRNTGAAAGSFYVDARTASWVDAQLVPDGSAAAVPLMPSASLGYLVPPDTSRVTGVASGSVPVSADLAPNTGEPERLGSPGPGNVAVVSTSSPAVSQGLWLLEADPVGPFSAVRAGTVSFAATAHMLGFDSSVSSATGDYWLGSVRAQAPAFHPVSVAPGGRGVISVTFTPAGPVGSVVSGWLYVDSVSLTNDAGDELVGIPYSYVVG